MIMSKVYIILTFCFLSRQALCAVVAAGGGYLEPVDKNDPEVLALASWAAKELDGRLVKVLYAQRQVVAGWLYYIDMAMKSKDLKVMQCRVEVWVRHWLKSIKLTMKYCVPANV